MNKRTTFPFVFSFRNLIISSHSMVPSWLTSIYSNSALNWFLILSYSLSIERFFCIVSTPNPAPVSLNIYLLGSSKNICPSPALLLEPKVKIKWYKSTLVWGNTSTDRTFIRSRCINHVAKLHILLALFKKFKTI